MSARMLKGALLQIVEIVKFDLRHGKETLAIWVFNFVPNLYSLKYFKALLLMAGGLECGVTSNFIRTPFEAVSLKKITIGDGVFINSGVNIDGSGGVEIGARCQIGPNVSIQTVNHKFGNWAVEAKPVTIGNNVWIGANVVVLPGAVIGDDTIVAAGSIVRGSIGGGLYAGQPAIRKRALV